MMARDAGRQAPLFELPPAIRGPVRVDRIRTPIWSDHKSRLIEEYLYLFVQITKHGNYIDGFAGPQYTEQPEMWSARRVLQRRPFFLRKFFLYELDGEKVELLERLVAEHQEVLSQTGEKRQISVGQGDCNVLIPQLLEGDSIGPREATFCLLDQRTFECHWSTVEAVAKHRTSGYKIELFYFMPTGWLDRSIAAVKNVSILQNWWGRDDWASLGNMTSAERLQALVDRVRDELGYAYVYPFPIFHREKAQGRVMYHMVHASDHKAAPKLMSRAYKAVVRPPEDNELQLDLFAAP